MTTKQITKILTGKNSRDQKEIDNMVKALNEARPELTAKFDDVKKSWRVDHEASQPADPIDDLMDGTRFRTPTDRGVLVSKVRTYIYAENMERERVFQERINKAVQELNAERRELQSQVETLEAAIYETKRHAAQEICSAAGRRANQNGIAEGAAERRG